MFKIDAKPDKKKGSGNIVDYLEKSEFKNTGFDYYQQFGMWKGEGSKHLSFGDNSINKGELDKLANCIHPTNGMKMGKKSKNGLEDSYLKTVLCAPKDFSLIYFLDTDLGQKELENDYRCSVNETIEFIEQFAYRKMNSRNELKKAKLIVADITHETSRPTKEQDKVSVLRPDPQKHEHLLFSRLCVDEEGKVGVLSQNLIFQNQIMIGTFFRKCLANKLRDRGYTLTRRVEFIDRDTKGTYTKNAPKIRVNTFAVEGITDEHRKYFSKRNSEIEALAQHYGTKTSVGKNKIANDYKQAKGNYERGELIEIWKNDANKLGLNNDYLQSLKGKKPVDNFLKNFRTDEELLASVVNNGKIYHKDIMSRLYEDEQWTGRKAEDVFTSLKKSGKISPEGKFVFKCNVDLSLILDKSKKLNNRIRVDKVKAYKILSSKGFTSDDLINNLVSHEQFSLLNSKTDNSIGTGLAKLIVDEEKREIREQREVERKWAQVRPAQNKKSENKSVSDSQAGLSDSGSLSSIEGLEGQLYDLNSKLSLAHLSESQKVRIALKMKILAKKIEEIKRKMINSKPKF